MTAKTLECPEFDQLLGAYVLDALPGEEKSGVYLHLAGCDRHQRTLDDLAHATSLLARAAVPREPSPELRRRIVSAVRSDVTPPDVSLGWTAERVPVGSHVCVFHSDEAGLKQTVAFLREGLDRPQEFSAVFADRRRFDTLSGWLQEGYAGSVQSCIDRGQVAFIGGAPQIDELATEIRRRLDQAMSDGYRLIRFLGFIGWGEPGWPDTTSLIEFEHRVNEVVSAYPAVVVCTYDLARLSVLSLVNAGLRTHPITVHGDRVERNNPFYLAA